MKKGYFKASGYGTFKRSRSDWRSVSKKGKFFYDVMGTKYKYKKSAAEANSFISAMGL